MQQNHRQSGLDSDQEQLATDQTYKYIEHAAQHYGLNLPRPEVRFDLRGQAAGMVQFKGRAVLAIRFNRQLLAENLEHFLRQTVAHEVAHVIAHALHGRRIRPHGPEWQAIMAFFEARPERCHSYATDKLPRRTLRRFTYRCSCGTHQLSSIRHNRVLKGQTYLCRRCTQPLTAAHPPG